MRRKVILSLFLVVSAGATTLLIRHISILRAVEVLVLHLFFLADVFIRPHSDGVDRESPWQGAWGKVLMLAQVYLPLYSGPGLVPDPWLVVVGLSVTTIGAMLALSGRMSLGRMGMPNLTIIPEPTLYTKGLYRFIRHPIYTGFALVFLGHQVTFLCKPGLIIWLIFVVSFIYPRIQVEEKMLVEQFGDRYLEYQKVSWSLLPYIY